MKETEASHTVRFREGDPPKKDPPKRTPKKDPQKMIHEQVQVMSGSQVLRCSRRWMEACCHTIEGLVWRDRRIGRSCEWCQGRRRTRRARVCSSSERGDEPDATGEHGQAANVDQG